MPQITNCIMKMKRNIIMLLLLTVCLNFTNTTLKAQNKTDWENLKLNGRVKTISENCYVADDNFGKLRKGQKLRDYNSLRDRIDLSPIKSTLFSIENLGIVQDFTFKFSPIGDLIEFDDFNGFPTYKHIFIYIAIRKCKIKSA